MKNILIYLVLNYHLVYGEKWDWSVSLNYDIGEQAKSLLASAGELPKAAKSLGFSKAPAALKAIKATTGVLKNIPNEVTAIGDESKKVIEEIDKVLKNIQSILSTT